MTMLRVKIVAGFYSPIEGERLAPAGLPPRLVDSPCLENS
jgi:hypothetical protein